ncbi:hypothetical protein [Streptomyces sp. NPDC127040]|uniref:hypothetical protein n=1 Tax=Streptomyces sp. NPDC127040 TaxID=3347116 RepID=UPI00365DF3BC
MADIADILKKAKRREKVIRICLAGDKLVELDEVERQLAGLGKAWEPGSLADADPRKELAEKVAALRTEIRESEQPFRFRALGDKEWSDLLAAHPSPDKDKVWDPETFGPALIAECAVDPVMSAEQVKELFEILNGAQRDELWRGAYEVNTEAGSIPFSLAGSGMLDYLTAAK